VRKFDDAIRAKRPSKSAVFAATEIRAALSANVSIPRASKGGTSWVIEGQETLFEFAHRVDAASRQAAVRIKRTFQRTLRYQKEEIGCSHPVANWYRLLVSNGWQADQILQELQSLRVTVGASLRASHVIKDLAQSHRSRVC
jgi:hypothetical protein